MSPITQKVSMEELTSTILSLASSRTNCKRLRSHKSTWPSEEADNKALNALETARLVTEALWPKRQAFGCKSTALEVDIRAQTEIVQSVPAEIRVRESAKSAYESCPWCRCSNRPISCSCQRPSGMLLPQDKPYWYQPCKNARFHQRIPIPYIGHNRGVY